MYFEFSALLITFVHWLWFMCAPNLLSTFSLLSFADLCFWIWTLPFGLASDIPICCFFYHCIFIGLCLCLHNLDSVCVKQNFSAFTSAFNLLTWQLEPYHITISISQDCRVKLWQTHTHNLLLHLRLNIVIIVSYLLHYLPSLYLYPLNKFYLSLKAFVYC